MRSGRWPWPTKCRSNSYTRSRSRPEGISAAPTSNAPADRVAARMVAVSAARPQVRRRVLRLSGGRPEAFVAGAGRTISGQGATAVAAEIVERLILVQSVETVRCLEEKVLRAPLDADVGAILGWATRPSARSDRLAA